MTVIRIIVVEDEAATARSLIHILNESGENLTIVKTLSSVSGAVTWFNDNLGSYDLIFMDIRLADGLSFDIFKQTAISRPVIFVTAFNDYAISAFKNNGIDYILKPFDPDEIRNALDKYKNWTGAAERPGGPALADLLAQLGNLTRSYKKSFLVHYRDKLIPLETAKIAWFYTANEVVHLRTTDDKQYVLESTMEQLEQQLDPVLFLRVSRQFILNRNAVIEAEFYFNGRLLVKIKPQPHEHVIISKAKSAEFKKWMNS
ncbi:LytR/AlgR family response regulator transcription factor [Dyadobacter subterraneus]|uniref:Response regulator transcription factor n=1 Tax=Dyadobacter subterraneus TaxID=2773304 RepID=A0ABR9WDX5_9BACT|nr:LytTR family DNA-binding domain-containing protein [Dyadobacter subterraneus]MBE9463694.1 response regulator transcription factor [Dyadobacter subterraneus]